MSTIYRVRNKKSGEQVLVEAHTKAGAINHISRGLFEAEALSASEAIRAVTVENLKVENAIVLDEAEDDAGVKMQKALKRA